MQPAIAQHLGGRLGIFVIAHREARALDQQLAFVTQPDLHTVQSLADAARTGRALQLRQHLRIFHEQGLRVGIGDGLHQLIGRVAGVERAGDRAVHQNALVHQIELRAGFRADRDVVAVTETQGAQPGGNLFGGFQVLIPGPGLDLFAARLPERHSFAVQGGGIAQQLRDSCGGGHGFPERA